MLVVHMNTPPPARQSFTVKSLYMNKEFQFHPLCTNYGFRSWPSIDIDPQDSMVPTVGINIALVRYFLLLFSLIMCIYYSYVFVGLHIMNLFLESQLSRIIIWHQS